MDSISQGVLGAAIGEAVLGKKVGNKGALFGAIIATIPDLDIILYLFYDKLEMLSIHRGFSHSIAFSFLGAFAIAFVLSKIKWLQTVKMSRLILLSWLCLFTHIFLDTFTAYGTQLFLPFSNRRLGFDSINVVDPIFTIPLIIGLVLSLWVYRSSPKRSKYNNWGLTISSLYLIFTLVSKEIAISNVSTHFAKKNIEYNDLLTMPIDIASINWYGVAKGKDSIYMKKYVMFSDEDYPTDVFAINDHYLTEIDAKVADKMRWFAKGFYTVEKENGKIRVYNLQVDMRGVVKNGDRKAPTIGYFELENVNGQTVFSSGSVGE